MKKRKQQKLRCRAEHSFLLLWFHESFFSRDALYYLFNFIDFWLNFELLCWDGLLYLLNHFTLLYDDMRLKMVSFLVFTSEP